MTRDVTAAAVRAPGRGGDGGDGGGAAVVGGEGDADGASVPVDPSRRSRALAAFQRSLPGRCVARYGADRGGSWAAAIALKLLLSLFPIVLSILFGVSLLLRNPGTRDSVLAQLGRALPGGVHGEAFVELSTTVDAVRSGTGLLALVGLAGLLWGGSGLFSEIEQAFSVVYRFPRRSFVAGKLMAVVMILVFGVLSVVGIAASSALALLTPIAEHAGAADILSGPPRYAVQVAVGVAAGLLLFASVYALVPRPRRGWRTVLYGALLAGAGFELLTLLFPLYIGVAGGGNRYGQTFGLLLLIVTYVYLLAQILMLGAVLNAVLEEGRAVRTATGAPAGQG